MDLIQFSPAQQARPAPAFALPARTGEIVRRSDYRDRHNLVLAFLPPDEVDAAPLLDLLAARLEAFRQQEAAVLAIAASPPGRAYPFPCLIDAGDQVRRRYRALCGGVSPAEAFLLVLDRYGAPYAALRGETLASPAAGQTLLDQLVALQYECPE